MDDETLKQLEAMSDNVCFLSQKLTFMNVKLEKIIENLNEMQTIVARNNETLKGLR